MVEGDAVNFLMDVCLKEWDAIANVEGNQNRMRFVESLCHKTKNNSPKYNFDKLFYKMPSYIRRAAIFEAIGKISSYASACVSCSRTFRITPSCFWVSSLSRSCIPDSRYGLTEELQSLEDGEVYLSKSFGEKYHVAVGDSVTLDEKYEDRQYTFRVAGFYDEAVSLSAYMPIDRFRSTFDFKADEISVVFGSFIVSKVWVGIMSRLSGWYSFKISLSGYAKMFLFILAGYVVVVFIDFGRIRKIPMDEALKHVE